MCAVFRCARRLGKTKYSQLEEFIRCVRYTKVVIHNDHCSPSLIA